MQNSLNNTQSTPSTANPQSAVEGAATNNGSEFQQTAPAEQLKERQESLSVESTGEPLPARSNVSSSGAGIWLWLAGFMVLLAVIVFIARLMIADDEGEQGDVEPSEEQAAGKLSSSPISTKKTAAKKTKSGKPATKKRKKSTKKRR